MGVQYSLWGGSVINLGTERHKEQYFDDIDQYRLPGVRLCFFQDVKSTDRMMVSSMRFSKVDYLLLVMIMLKILILLLTVQAALP